MKALERRQEILEILCRRKFETVDNLAFEFGVHRNTILNDILELSLSYPIYTKKGGRNSGGVYIAEDYYLGKKYLSPEEQSLLESLTSTVGAEDKRLLLSILNKFGKKGGV